MYQAFYCRMFQVKKGPHLAVLLGCILYGMTGLFLAGINNLPITSIIFYRLFFGLAFIFTFLLATGRLGELKPGKKISPSPAGCYCHRKHVLLFPLRERNMFLRGDPA